ncbi:unnamed protein product, partial [Effrenium voratum]
RGAAAARGAVPRPDQGRVPRPAVPLPAPGGHPRPPCARPGQRSAGQGPRCHRRQPAARPEQLAPAGLERQADLAAPLVARHRAGHEEAVHPAGHHGAAVPSDDAPPLL